MLCTEFLRHLSMIAKVRHKGLAVGNFTYSLQVSYVLSLFTQSDKDIFYKYHAVLFFFYYEK